MTQKKREYSNGDVIELKPYAYPLISHFGVLVFLNGEWWVLHTTEDTGVSKQRLEETLKTGKFVAVRPSKISGIDTWSLMQRFSLYEGMKYDLKNLNCEAFVNLMTKEKIISWQYIFGASAVFTVGLLIIIRILRK
jgi:hypothetical protein